MGPRAELFIASIFALQTLIYLQVTIVRQVDTFSPLWTINRNQKKWSDSPSSESHFQILVHRSLAQRGPGNQAMVGSITASACGEGGLTWPFKFTSSLTFLGCLLFPVTVDPPSLSPSPPQSGEFRGLKELLVPCQEARCLVLRCLKVGKPTAGLAHRPESPPQHLYNCSPQCRPGEALQIHFEQGVGWGRKPQKSE